MRKAEFARIGCLRFRDSQGKVNTIEMCADCQREESTRMFKNGFFSYCQKCYNFRRNQVKERLS